MSNLFGAGVANENVEAEKDFSKRTLDTDVYAGTIKMAFAGQSSGGARSLTLQLQLDGGKQYDETIYVSNKDGLNTYEKDGKKYMLPGFQLVNNLCLMAIGKGLMDAGAGAETRTVKLYDFKEKKEIAQDVMALPELIGKRVLVAIQEEEYEKSTYNESTGKREYTGEKGIKNSITKVYDPETKQTAVEIRDEKEATQMDAWLATNKGKLKTVELKGKAQAGQNSKPKPSGLF